MIEAVKEGLIRKLVSDATMRLALLITGLLALMPSPDAPDKDLKPGIGLGSHRSPKNIIP